MTTRSRVRIVTPIILAAAAASAWAQEPPPAEPPPTEPPPAAAPPAPAPAPAAPATDAQAIQLHGFVSAAWSQSLTDPDADTLGFRVFDFDNGSIKVDVAE